MLQFFENCSAAGKSLHCNFLLSHHVFALTSDPCMTRAGSQAVPLSAGYCQFGEAAAGVVCSRPPSLASVDAGTCLAYGVAGPGRAMYLPSCSPPERWGDVSRGALAAGAEALAGLSAPGDGHQKLMQLSRLALMPVPCKQQEEAGNQVCKLQT